MDNKTALNIIRTYVKRRVGTLEDKNKGYYYTNLWRVINKPLFSSVEYVETEGSIQVARERIRDVLMRLEKTIGYKDVDVGYLLNYTKSDSA